MTTDHLPGGLEGRRTEEAARVSSVVVFKQDDRLRYTWIHNPSEGFRAEDVIGKTDQDLVGEDEARKLSAIKLEALSTGRARRIETCLSVRGRLRWYDLSVYPERGADRRINGVLCTAVNITEQKHTEDVLRQRTQRMALLFEAATGLLATADPIRFMEHLFGRLAVLLDLDVFAHYAVSGDGTHLRLAASGGLTPEQRLAMQRLELGQPPCGAVALTRRPIIVGGAQRADARVVDTVRSLGLRAYVCHPLIAAGELFGTLAFGSKTDTEHTEESIGLFRAVSDLVALAISRQRAEQSLRQADQRKDEFIATLAHELRNPLAPLRSGIDLMRAAPQDRDTVDVTLAVMERQVVQLTRLVDDLLEVSRITQGRLELRRHRVELSAIIESALDQTRGLLEEAGHELTLDLPEDPIVLDGDPVRLAQVLANLISNAAKYTPERGHVWISAEKTDDGVTLRVRDDGIGIPADKIGNVFEMFEQVDRSFERGYKGLGLGLTLVRSLVEMHGGSVEARSGGPGKGSELVIRLPAASPAAAPKDVPGAAAEEARRGPVRADEDASRRRVLIVDDNVDAASMLGKLVLHLGHDARVVYSGIDALEAVPAFHPEIVLLDIGMPGMNGYEVARRIREGSGAARPLLVALTGWGQSKDRQRAADAGFDHYVVKPVERAVLQQLFGAPSHRGRP